MCQPGEGGRCRERIDLAWASVYLSALAVSGLFLLAAFASGEAAILAAIALIAAIAPLILNVVLLLSVPGERPSLLRASRILLWLALAALLAACVFGVLTVISGA
ncbi:MAG: hypothetical protein ACE5GW_13235 [Planctomycetota bacterium]